MSDDTLFKQISDLRLQNTKLVDENVELTGAVQTLMAYIQQSTMYMENNIKSEITSLKNNAKKALSKGKKRVK